MLPGVQVTANYVASWSIYAIAIRSYIHCKNSIVFPLNCFVPVRILFTKKCPYWDKKCPEDMHYCFYSVAGYDSMPDMISLQQNTYN